MSSLAETLQTAVTQGLAAFAREQPVADARPSAVCRLACRADTWDDERRTVDVVASSGADVLRYDFWSAEDYVERLDMSPEAVDLSRAVGAPVLNAHARFDLGDVLGVVEEAHIEAGVGLVARLRFSANESTADIVRNIRDGIITQVSIGYHYLDRDVDESTEGGLRVFTVRRWQLLEISPVPIGADPGGRIRGGDMLIRQRHARRAMAPPDPAPAPVVEETPEVDVVEFAPVEPAAPASTRASVLAMMRQAHNLGLDPLEDEVAAIIEGPGTELEVRGRLLDLHASRHDATRINAAFDVDGTAGAKLTRAMAEGVEMRLGLHSGEPRHGGGAYANRSALEICRELLERRGHSTGGMSRRAIAQNAMRLRAGGGLVTGDLPAVFGSTARRSLQRGFDSFTPTYTQWIPRVDVVDLRQVTHVKAGSGGLVSVVAEGTPYPRVGFSDAHELYQAVKRGEILSITIEMLINDDLGVLTRRAAMLGSKFARTREYLVAELLASGNGPTLVDTFDLFDDTNHENDFGVGAPSATNLGGVNKKMALITQLGGTANVDFGGIMGRYLVHPVALARSAHIATGRVAPVPGAAVDDEALLQTTTTSGVEPITMPMLDGFSTAKWFVAADGNQVEHLQYGELQGEQGVVLTEEPMTDSDRIDMKARQFWYVAAVEHRNIIRAGV